MRRPPVEFSDLAITLLREGRPIRFTARGVSMKPFIVDGDVLTIVPVAPSSIRPGDVILYSGGAAGVTLHRVLGRRCQGGEFEFRLRGDARTGPCERVRAADLLGRATTRHRGDRAVRVDSPARRWAGVFWASCQPLGIALLRAAGRARRIGAPVRAVMTR